MTPDQIRLIQKSFAKVAMIPDQAAALFYGRLFEVAPSVKPLFRGDMTIQGRKLVATRHYAVVGETLLWTLERGLGSQWTSDLAAAWAAAYGALSAFMINETYGRTEAAG